MLLVKRKTLHSLIMGCTLASLVSSPVSAGATDPENTSSAVEDVASTAAEVAPVVAVQQQPASINVSQSREMLTASLPADVSLKYLSELAPIYAASDMKLMWADVQLQQQFQPQLAEMALAGINPHFGQWAK